MSIPAFQHGDEGHLVEGADPVEVNMWVPAKTPEEQQTDKDGKDQSAYQKLFLSFSSMVCFLICRS